ncbi:MAG: hypothetical protein GY811_26385 [Myxococcales bacterium]|nr:hypothetical protein [Myxococcales bacterium]
MRKQLCAVAGALVALGGAARDAGAEGQDKRSWKISLESGAEYDSNLHRVEVLDGEVAGVDAGPLMRSGARYEMTLRPDEGSQLRLDLRGASKVFAVPAGQSENLAMVLSDLRYQRRLGASRASLALRGNYYDAIDIRPFGEGDRPAGGRSFRTSELGTGLSVPSEDGHQLSLLLGVRDFEYKPDSDYSWRGAQAGLQYASKHWIGDPDTDESAAFLDFRAAYRLGMRSYQGAAFRNTCAPDEMPTPDCFVPTDESRGDMNHSLVVEGVYTGKQIYSLLYGAEVVDSNSYGQALLRQHVEFGFTSELFAEVFLTARAIVRLNTFLDPLLLARDIQNQSFVSIEDENRNSLSLHLARDLSSNWGAELRVAVYGNEFATEELRFRRQTAYLGLLYRFDAASRPRL